jgi:hypothetical protein
MSRAWLSLDEDLVRRGYRTVPIDDLVRALGRPATAIRRRASSLGVTRPLRPLTAAERRRVLALHAAGYTDGGAAREMGRDSRAVKRVRERAGLPANTLGPRHRAALRAGHRKGCEVNDAVSLAEVRAAKYRCEAAALGWPIDLPAPCVRILRALHERGPMGRRAIVAAIGARWLGPRKSLKGARGINYLGLLKARGLVVGRPARAEGGRFGVRLYALAPGVRPGRALALGDPTAVPPTPECLPEYRMGGSR